MSLVNFRIERETKTIFSQTDGLFSLQWQNKPLYIYISFSLKSRDFRMYLNNTTLVLSSHLVDKRKCSMKQREWFELACEINSQRTMPLHCCKIFFSFLFFLWYCLNLFLDTRVRDFFKARFHWHFFFFFYIKIVWMRTSYTLNCFF